MSVAVHGNSSLQGALRPPTRDWKLHDAIGQVNIWVSTDGTHGVTAKGVDLNGSEHRQCFLYIWHCFFSHQVGLIINMY